MVNMDEQVKTILLTFCFDLCIFLMELSVFFCIRSRRGDEQRGGRSGLFNYNPVAFTLKEFNKDDMKESVITSDAYGDVPETNKSSLINDSPQPTKTQSYDIMENINNFKVPLSGRKSVYANAKKSQLQDPLIDSSVDEESARLQASANRVNESQVRVHIERRQS